MVTVTMHRPASNNLFQIMDNKRLGFMLPAIAILLLCVLSATAIQGPKMLTISNYAAFAQRESMVLKTKYHLDAKQYSATQSVNNWFYLNMARAFTDYKLAADRKQKISLLNSKREADLKDIFSTTQFAEYTKDRLALGIVVKHRIDSLNKLQKFRAVRFSDNAH